MPRGTARPTFLHPGQFGCCAARCAPLSALPLPYSLHRPASRACLPPPPPLNTFCPPPLLPPPPDTLPPIIRWPRLLASPGLDQHPAFSLCNCRLTGRQANGTGRQCSSSPTCSVGTHDALLPGRLLNSPCLPAALPAAPRRCHHRLQQRGGQERSGGEASTTAGSSHGQGLTLFAI